MNKINDVYLEIPRYDKGMTWWGMIPLGGGVLGVIIYILIDTISTQTQSNDGDFIPYFIALMGVCFFSSMLLGCIRIYFIAPREEPVRLNKMRQRIFVYKYKRIEPIPWLKWPVIISRYNWEDVHGEIRYCSDRYRAGHQLWGSVCEPGTYKVIHRFQLADGEPAELQQVWSFLCLYMKGEPVPAKPKNKGKPDSWRPRKADKWPADMELESTTAPGGEQQSVSYQKALTESEK